MNRESVIDSVTAAEERKSENPPGWKKNPDAAGLRYWDGHSWTDSYHPGNTWTDNATAKEVLWGLSLGFGMAGGSVAAIGLPVLAFYFPLGLGAAGAALAIAAFNSRGPTPWYAVIAVLASVAAIAIGFDGYSEFNDASRTLNDLGE